MGSGWLDGIEDQQGFHPHSLFGLFGHQYISDKMTGNGKFMVGKELGQLLPLFRVGFTLQVNCEAVSRPGEGNACPGALALHRNMRLAAGQFGYLTG